MIKKFIRLALIIFFLAFSLFRPQLIINNFKNVYQLAKKEPQNKTYFTDETKYLKNYYLMKRGLNYYQAHLEAMEQLGGKEDRVWNEDFWGWRLPTIFYFWKIFSQDGRGIVNLFILFTFLTIINAYFIAKKFTDNRTAFLSSMVLIPYFLNPLGSRAFLFITWWALFFFIFGLMFFYYRRFFLSTFFFTLAVNTREHFIIPIIIMLILSIIFKKKKKMFIIPLVVFIIMVYYHSQKVSSIISLESSLGVGQRLVGFSKKLFLATLSFSTNSYFFVSLRPALVWIFSSLVGLGYLIYKSKQKYKHLIALTSFLSLLLIIPFMTASKWKDYWGVTYVPLAAIFSPTIFRLFNENKKVNKK